MKQYAESLMKIMVTATLLFFVSIKEYIFRKLQKYFDNHQSSLSRIKRASINENSLDDIRFFSYAYFFKLQYSRIYIQSKKLSYG